MNTILLSNYAGECLHGDGRFKPTAGDAAIWQKHPGGLHNLVYGTVFRPVGDLATDERTAIEVDGVPLSTQPGPERMPSEYLEELRDRGFTILDNLMTDQEVDRLKRKVAHRIASNEQKTDGRLGVGDGVTWSADVARVVTHPVALWLMQTYLGTKAIHYCHPPSVTCMRPAKELLGKFPELGWHTDYPYHPGVLERERWGDDRPLGVQFNVCVDEFRADNAATQYLPNSVALRQWPTEEFNTGGTRMGKGVHKDVVQMTAPSGSALVYDSRTWHRACDELNVSGEDRVAILNAVTPSWVLPMVDKSQSARTYRSADTNASLTTREQKDIRRLCHAKTRQPPKGAPIVKHPVRAS
ncbi:MAG: hypothetical protein CMQ05_13700 [Gammaproteobacteria bacterium]|nr:hypothetical protein [Gammaproteobacteria bacterium]RPG23863.1 MAG: hypothetical protein CBC10_013320 [Gammaproteobacteria bacterium TMED50]|tara:strand:- start:6076 stop:7140 length:1065 start_codon:yes stop_codon:yes gene_type:complete